MYDLTLQQVVIRTGALLLIVAVHGYALAGCAKLLGDPGPQHDGRLKPSPFVHVDLTGLVSGIIFQLGWGRQIDIDPLRLRVGRAGLVLCWIASLLAVLLFAWALQFLQTPAQSFLGNVGAQDAQVFLTETGRLAVWFALFNLLPIPPLAGAMLLGAIDPGLIATVRKSYFVGVAVLVILAFTGVAAKLFQPLYATLTRVFNIH